MTGQHEDDQDYIEVDDLGDALRPSALEAWNVPETIMTVVDTVTDLPLAAALQGPQSSRRMFAPQADAYGFSSAHETPLSYGTADRAGIDLVRITAEAPFGRIVVVDTAAFTVFSVPADVPLAGGVLNITGPSTFHDPDTDGWSTTTPDLWVQNMSDWHDRIDRRDVGMESLYMLYKTFPSSRVFTPSLAWF